MIVPLLLALLAITIASPARGSDAIGRGEPIPSWNARGAVGLAAPAPEPRPAEPDEPEPAVALVSVAPTLFVEDGDDVAEADGLALPTPDLSMWAEETPAAGELVLDPLPEIAAGAPGRGEGLQADVPGWLLVFNSTLGKGLVRPAPGARGEPFDPDGALVRDRASAGRFSGFRFATTAVDTESADLRMLVVRGEQWHVLSLAAMASSRALDMRLRAYGQLAYLPPPRGSGMPEWARPASAEDGGDPAALGLKVEVEGAELGAEYRSLGRRLERVVRVAPSRRDQEGSEVWVARRTGVLRLRLSQSELSDNVDRNPALPRTTKAQTAASAELKSPAWPVLGLTYATGDSERTWLTPSRRNRGADRQDFDSVAATVYYDGADWQASGASTYATSSDRVAPERDTASFYQDVALTLRLTAALAVVGTATVGAEQDHGSDTRSDTRATYLTLAYVPPKSRWHAWTQAGQTSRRSTDGAVDGQSLTVGGGLGCDLGRVLSGRARMSVEAGYDQYVDRATPTSSAQGAYGFLRLTLPAF